MLEQDNTVYIDAGEVTQLANEKKLAGISLIHYPDIGITRATIEYRNGATGFRVKLSKRKASDKTKEKLFKSIDGVTRWAFNLISKSTYDGHPCSYRMDIYPSTTSATIDGIDYNKNNPFDWDRHHKK